LATFSAKFKSISQNLNRMAAVLR